ncbi:MAG TPA: TonB-dependent receptor [Terriglobia bacterium]|nr:TonB-dependent receptor [Terriglobia bacterium]
MACKKVLLAFFVIWGLAYPLKTAYSQIVYGNIIGTVTDASGAAIPGAKVTITNVGTGVSTTTTTNQSGNYTQLHLAAGTYTVKVEAQGFQVFLQQNVIVVPDSALQVNAQMQLGTVTQQVQVTAAPPNLQTQNTDVHTLYSAQTLSSLPVLNRNFAYFELMTPGAQELGWQHASSEDPQGSVQMMVNGQHFAGTSWILDGTDNHDEILGIMAVNPNIDSLADAKVITSDYSAEYGEADAGVVTATTKSGTNQIHGSAFEYRQTAFGESRNPFSESTVNAVTHTALPSTLYNQFGGSLGGPIRKDKTFIFGDYQGARESNGGSVLTFVPTAAMRSGDLSALGVPIFNPFDANGNVIPCGSAGNCSRQQFPGNVIPTNMLSSQSQYLLSHFLPSPNISGATGGQPNYSALGTEAFNINNFDVKVDQYQTEKLHIFGRYSFQQYYQQAPGAFGAEGGGPNFDGIHFAGISSNRDSSLAAGFDYTVSPNLLTDFRFAFFRYRVFVNPNGLGTTPATDAGIPGLNISPITNDMPAFFVGGAGGFNLGYALGVNQCNCPLNEQEQQFQFVDNWTYLKGNHTIEWGTDLRHLMNLRVPSDSHRAGELSFNPSFTEGVTGTNVGGGLGLADFLLGGVTSFGRYVSNVTDAAERQNREFFFGQDTWRITPKLSLNYGLRWEIYNPQYVNAAGNGGWVYPTNGETYVAGQQGVGLNGNIQNSLANFGPRAGLAYQINDKTVLRMGYGRFFDSGVFGSTFGHTVTQNLPVLGQQQLSPAAGYADVFSFNQGPAPFNPTTALDAAPMGPGGHHIYPVGVSPHMLPLQMRLPTVDAWNVTLEREINPDTNFSLAWVGNKGTHVFIGDGPNYNINNPTIVGYNTLSLPGCPAPCTNAREPFFQKYGWNQGVQWYGNDVSNNYESLQAVFNKRFTKDYMINASYTWSRDFNFNSSYYIYNPSLVYGPTDFNRTNAFIVQHIYNLPFGKGERFGGNASKWENYAIGGWQWNGVTTLESGMPFTPSFQNCGSTQDVGICQPNRVGNVTLANRTQNQWFVTVPTAMAPGTTAGPWGAPNPGVLGNMGFDSMIGPHLFNSDMSMYKSFQITEKLKGQFEADIFNAFNVANLGLPNGCVDCGKNNNSGVINSTAAGTIMRTMQFGIHLYW